MHRTLNGGPDWCPALRPDCMTCCRPLGPPVTKTKKRWCYVEKAACRQPDVQASSWFGRGKLYYSYSACGSVDGWSMVKTIPYKRSTAKDVSNEYTSLIPTSHFSQPGVYQLAVMLRKAWSSTHGETACNVLSRTIEVFFCNSFGSSWVPSQVRSDAHVAFSWRAGALLGWA